jgi:hypothetical protein
MAEVTATDDIALSADKVWSVIGDFSGIRKWAVLVQAETTRQTPEGPVRTLTMPDGRQVHELLVRQDAHSYTYSLDRPDMTEYASTVAVVPAGAAASRIKLTIRYSPRDPSAEGEIAERLARNLRGNVKAMKKALGIAV